MNLSQRLDQARAQREAARSGKDPGYELRMQVEQQTYDGRNLRTGKRMTDEEWRALHWGNAEQQGLPPWNPRRANELVTRGQVSDELLPNDLVAGDAILDLTRPGADVIDLRSRARSDEPDDVFEMPAWAPPTERVFRSEDE